MPRNSRTVAIMLALSCALGNGLGAEPGVHYGVRSWGTREGLPASSVIAITQTRDGYLWLGTRYGLVRFDGLHFHTFDRDSAGELSSAAIVQLFEDSQGGLWVGTDREGIRRVKDGRVLRVRTEGDLQAGPAQSICEDHSGAVWLCLAGGQIMHFQEGIGKIANPPGGLRGGFQSMIAEQSGALWLATGGALFTSGTTPPQDLKGPPAELVAGATNVSFVAASARGGFWCFANRRVQKWETNHLVQDFGPFPWNQQFEVKAACEDRQGNLVVGTLGDGVWWFGTNGKATQISEREGLSHSSVLCMCPDREGNLWVGTDGGGLNLIKPEAFAVSPETLGKNVQSVTSDGHGGVIYGLFYGGIAQLTGDKWKQLGAGRDITNMYVGSVFVDGNKSLWAAVRQVVQPGPNMAAILPRLLEQTAGGVFQPALQGGYATAIYEDRQHRLWVGGEGWLACRTGQNWKSYGAADGFPIGTVKAIADDAGGAVWLGTEGNGLWRFKDGKFSSFHVQDGLPDEHVSALLWDDDNGLWIGTLGGGLARFKAGRWTCFRAKDGLASDIIDFLLDDGRGDLWAGSNVGLMRLQKSELNDFAAERTGSVSCRAYREQDGLPSGECSDSQPAACRTSDGKLWFCTIKGLVSLDPGWLAPNTNPPPVAIESALVEGRSQNTNGIREPLQNEITVPAGREHVEIQYTSLNLATADKARFRYRMGGLETNWVEAETRRVAPYSKLPPGRHDFQVTACNEDGVWNPAPATVTLLVLPPFWRTTWFLTASALALLGIIVAVVHYVSTQKLQRQLAGMRQQQALENERSRIARDIHDQLGASVTQVSLLGEMVEGDKEVPAEVEAHARQISQTARDISRVLDEIVWTVNPSNDTLEGLVNYVCKYAQEYLAVAGLRFRFDVPGQLPEAVISPEVRHNVFLAAKEAVTNVVRHARAKSVFVRLKLETSAFVLEIQDDGQGLSEEVRKKMESRNGLRNMGRRMEDVGGSFEILPAAEGGTVVRLTAPIKRN